VERFDAASPAFILIHGTGDGAFVWDLFAPVLGSRYTTLVVDLRGHGNSGWDLSGRYAVDDFVSDIEHVVEHSGLEDFVVIGHSLGAHIAVRLRARYPERVVASVLVDFAPELNAEGACRARSLLKSSLKVYPTTDSYADWLKQTRPLTQLAALDHIATSATRRAHKGFVLKLDPALAKAPADITPSEASLLWALLRQQSCPALVVRGVGSALVSQSVARTLVAALPRGTLASISFSGHSVMLDNPAEFERVVLGFLATVPERSISFRA
jgi:pimeloyl-ACP methyl ester carboxylesterase